MHSFIKQYTDLRFDDITLVGAKNAALGEMTSRLQAKGRKVPPGFATTADAWWRFMQYNEYNGLSAKLGDLLDRLDRPGFANLSTIGSQARQLICCATMPDDVAAAIASAYAALSPNDNLPVVIRSSPFSLEEPAAGFAGLHKSYSDISGETSVIDAVQLSFASVYSDKAISHRENNGIAHHKMAMCTGIQTMVRSDYPDFIAFLLEKALDNLALEPNFLCLA